MNEGVAAARCDLAKRAGYRVAVMILGRTLDAWGSHAERSNHQDTKPTKSMARKGRHAAHFSAIER
jgi:hypothetical protein